MKNFFNTTLILFTLSVFGFTTVHAYSSPHQPTNELGKYRVLVDKVLSKENNWTMTATHVQQIAEAGFNVISPRYGADKDKSIRNIARFAQEQNVKYIPWMRGTLHAEGRHKLVDATGLEHPICSPDSDELWDWMNERILSMAQISVDEPALIGVFLDFENYSFEKQPEKRTGHAYPLSYDQNILKNFSRSQGIKIPKLKKANKYLWLIEEGHHEAFQEFQISKWKKRAQNLRAAIDKINPHFQFFIYPAGETLFLEEVAFLEWATPKAPLVIAESKTFGRPSTKMLQKPALETNRTIIRTKQTDIQDTANLQYIGGINPLVNAADPEFSARNAVMLSEYSNGFWVFYEGPENRSKS